MAGNTVPKLELTPNCIVETVVSTYLADNRPTAAPMGVVFRKDGKLVIKPYTTTQTYRNLRSRRQCVVNLTKNPEIFFRAAFKQGDKRCMLPASWFEMSETVDAPRLRVADACLEVRVTMIREEGGRAVVLCDVQHAEVLNPTVEGYCRANFAVIESIIHATRLKMALSKGRKAEAERLATLIRHYQKIVERVARKTKYAHIMEKLVAMLNLPSKEAEEHTPTP